MSSGQILLFDLASKPPCKTWSPNPWKTRLVLNYKGLDYTTEWLEFPDIKPRLEPHLPPHPTGAAYTVPTVRLASGEYVSDSRAIAARLEAAHPTPALHLGSAQLARLEAAMPGLFVALRPVYMPRVPGALLGGPSAAYWHATRPGIVGAPSLEQYAAEHPAEEAWAAAGPALRQVTAWLAEDPSGPFFMGREVSYADFVWGAFLLFCRRLGGDVWESLLREVGDAGVHLRLLEGIEPWTKRDDH